MKLEVITPEKKMFEGNVEAVQFPGVDGSFQVLDNHAPIISVLSSGKVKIDLKEKDQGINDYENDIEVDGTNENIIRLSIKGGVMELRNNHIIVLAD